MSSSRRTQWIDAVETTRVALNGAAAPGTINNDILIGENEVENVGGNVTLLRTVGDLWIQRNAGNAVVTATMFLGQAFAGAVQPTDWNQDAFQRRENLYSWMVVGSASDEGSHIVVDVRTKRKIGQGQSLYLSLQNHSIAGNDARYAFHFRHLILLP